jgi:hypothetical protein
MDAATKDDHYERLPRLSERLHQFLLYPGEIERGRIVAFA